MTPLQLFRISGISLLAGSVAFVTHLVLRSAVTAGVEPAVFATHSLWVPINALGTIGATLVLLGLPAMYMPFAVTGGRASFMGIALVAVSWVFFGVFLSLYAMIVVPWLARNAPLLLAPSAPLPDTFVVSFIVALVAWIAGTILLAIPFLKGRVQPRWVGYVLCASALWIVIGNFVLAPHGPAANVVVNLISNFAPVLFLIAAGHLGYRMGSAPGPGAV